MLPVNFWHQLVRMMQIQANKSSGKGGIPVEVADRSLKVFFFPKSDVTPTLLFKTRILQ